MQATFGEPNIRYCNREQEAWGYVRTNRQSDASPGPAFQFVGVFNKNSNKGNQFYLSMINNISDVYKIAIIGDKLDITGYHNIKYFFWPNRKKAKKIIALSKFGILTKENIFSLFALDCLSLNVPVFFNKDLKISNYFKNHSSLIPIYYSEINKSSQIILKNLKKKNKPIKFDFKRVNFLEYLD